jgi:hypothetical protein
MRDAAHSHAARQGAQTQPRLMPMFVSRQVRRLRSCFASPRQQIFDTCCRPACSELGTVC